MSSWITRWAAIVWALCATSACSNSRANAAPAAGADPADASTPVGADTGAVALDCGRVFSAADVAGLLNAPVTVVQTPGSTSWCSFGNPDLGDITVRIGGGPDDEGMWDDATVSSNRVKFVALSGVGDQAVRKAKDGAQVSSRKGKLYCTVTALGGTGDGYRRLGGDVLAKRLGALCNKAFAALRA